MFSILINKINLVTLFNSIKINIFFLFILIFNVFIISFFVNLFTDR